MSEVTYEQLLEKPDEHSEVGPSSLDRVLVCPGSVQLSRGLPDTASAFADEGTFAHHISELSRLNDVPAREYIGQVSHCDRFTVDQVFADHVEERVEFDAWVPGGFGTVDDLRFDDGMCYLTDLKFGQGVKVYSRDPITKKLNPQLMAYALGVFQQFGHLYDIDCFQLNICQPRLDHIDEETVSLKEILLWARDQLQPIAEVALGSNPPFQAGDNCRWCRARDSCAHRKDWTMAQMLDELDDLESMKDPDLMDNKDLAVSMSVIDVIRAWCNDIESRTLSEVQAGREVGGWKMVAGRSIRKWRSNEEAEAALRKTKLKVADILPPKLISPAGAEKLLGKKHPLLVELVVKPPGAPKLAPPTDPRPSVTPDVSELDD
jgi:hypothetical protein